MVGADHNLNGSHDLTTPLSGWFTIQWALALVLATVRSLSPFSTHYEDMKGDTKC